MHSQEGDHLQALLEDELAFVKEHRDIVARAPCKTIDLAIAPFKALRYTQQLEELAEGEDLERQAAAASQAVVQGS